MSSLPGGGKSPAVVEPIQVLAADNLLDIPWLVHGFSTRHGGVSEAYGGGALNLGITREDTREAVLRNRQLFLSALGAVDGDSSPWPSAAMRQIHSSQVHAVTELPRHPLAGDGLVTSRAGLVLAVRTADCLPVLLADPVQRAVGAIHAGWRGTLARVVENGVGAMRLHFGSDPADLKAAIGPGIHRCCYEVGEEMRDSFASQFSYAAELFQEVSSSDPVRRKYPLLFMNMRAPGHGEPPRTVHLDLVEANRRQLLDAGLLAENVWVSPLCTSCRTDLLFSYRAEKGGTGRMMGAIGIKK
jgi:purine-nucleoside/S-methyl-5'-thioadenosine phosphorylase / adenosine deaminase